MDLINLTWNEFLKDSENFLKLSQRLGDEWYMHKKDDIEGNRFLVYKQKIPFTSSAAKKGSEREEITSNEVENIDMDVASASVHDMLQVEYHIVYSISYQVPVLFFQAHRSDGSLVGLEDAWRIFCMHSIDEGERTRDKLLMILTQMDHPILFKPFLALHPCRTAELLAQAGKSDNHILTFLSVMGPFVKLNLNNAYGLAEAEQEKVH